MEWALGDGQLEWIKAQLSEAKSKKQLVCMFGHIPLTKNIHSSKCILWDSEKLQNLLKENGQHTAAYISGKKLNCKKIIADIEHIHECIKTCMFDTIEPDTVTQLKHYI